jgi:hypothetical protein
MTEITVNRIDCDNEQWALETVEMPLLDYLIDCISGFCAGA